MGNNYHRIKGGKPLRIADIIAIAAALIITLAGLVFLQPQGKGEYAYIYSGNQLIRIMPLAEDDVFLYSYGEHFNEITVSGGKVYVSRADCNDRLCVNAAPIQVTGSSIACLPHNLYIVVVGGGGVDETL